MKSKNRDFRGETIRISVWGGPQGETIKKCIVQPFMEETGAQVIVEHGETSKNLGKLRSARSAPALDIVGLDHPALPVASRENLVEVVERDAIPRLAYAISEYKKQRCSEYAVPLFAFYYALIYNTAFFKTLPETWEVLWWDTVKAITIDYAYTTAGALEVIMAAMLSGGDQYNVESGFRKLAELKPKVVCYSLDAACLEKHFRTGTLQVGPGMIQYVKSLIEAGYNVDYTTNMREGFFFVISTLAKVKGHPGKSEVIDAFLNLALTRNVQVDLAKGVWYTPVVTDLNVFDEFPEKIARRVHMNYDRAIKVDWEYVYEKHPEWTKRRLAMGL